MNLTVLLKSLLPGLAPLLVFVAADSLFGEAVGLAVGLAVGALEFGYTWLRDKKPDPFVAADTGLLVLAGGLSLGLDNDLFFKLKPAAVELALGAAFALLAFLPTPAVKAYFSRQLRGFALADSAVPALRRSLKLLLAVLAGHVALTVWAALAASTAVWGFVSGGLLYILFALVAVVPFAAARVRAARLKRASGGEEMLPLVDDAGRVVGAARRSECHQGPGKLHPVVHLHIVDGRGRLYLQKRAAGKLVQPGKWDTAVGGHVAAGEDLALALARETREELGVAALATGRQPQPLLRYRWDTELESELVHVFALEYSGPFTPDPAEVEEGRFWTPQEIRAELGAGKLTPNFEHEYRLLMAAVLDRMAAAGSAPAAPASAAPV